MRFQTETTVAQPLAVQVASILDVPAERVQVTVAPTSGEEESYIELVLYDVNGLEVDIPLDKQPELSAWVRGVDVLAEEYLAFSAPSITQPQMWYLLRLYGKMLGLRVEGS